MSARLLTKQNLDEGFVEIPVEFIHGDSATIRITAPNWRKRRELILAFQKVLDTSIFMQECLAPALSGASDQVERFLDRLTPESLARVENYSVAITLGEQYQKKMQEVGTELLTKMAEAQTIILNGSAPKVESRETAASASEKSKAGPGPG